jgi:glycosyltransferase involved in cell wall biosynthesis
MVCRASHQWLRREVPGLASHAVFIHLTENDRAGFEQVAPGHSHIIASAGTDIDPLMNGNEVSKSDKIIISFVGTLQVQMAFDALRHFHDKFEGSLRAAFGNNLVLQVIGSNPAQAVRDLCREGGWQLYENVSDAKLSQMLAQSTFTMLPFAYATGIKLKLIRSLGSGVPFLSTLVARPPSFVAPPGCCFSNDPNDWVGAIRTWCEQPDLLSARKQLLTVAESFSWPVVVSKLADSIRQFAI